MQNWIRLYGAMFKQPMIMVTELAYNPDPCPPDIYQLMLPVMGPNTAGTANFCCYQVVAVQLSLIRFCFEN